MHRVFVPPSQIPDIIGSDVHYIRNVLRLGTGDEIEIFDGTGKIYTAKISKTEKEKITCAIIASKQEESEPKTKVTLAQALVKGQKMDFIMEKCVELGAHAIIPMVTERTIAKHVKLDRWRKIAKESAEQSGRAIVPEIASLIKFKEILKIRGQFDLALIPWEMEKEATLKSVLKDQQPKNLLVLIGPEGGFSQKEMEKAKEAGFISVSLGKRILRAETAGLAALAAIMYELEE